MVMEATDKLNLQRSSKSQVVDVELCFSIGRKHTQNV